MRNTREGVGRGHLSHMTGMFISTIACCRSDGIDTNDMFCLAVANFGSSRNYRQRYSRRFMHITLGAESFLTRCTRWAHIWGPDRSDRRKTKCNLYIHSGPDTVGRHSLAMMKALVTQQSTRNQKMYLW